MVRGGLGEDEIKKNWQVLETGGWGAQQRLGDARAGAQSTHKERAWRNLPCVSLKSVDSPARGGF